MSENRFEELLALLVDDEITTQQIDEIVQLAATDPEKLIELRTHLNLSDRLSQYEDDLRSGQRFMDALQTRVRAAGESDDFVKKLVASAKKPKPPFAEKRFHLSAGWVVAAIALSILAVVFAAEFYRGGHSTHEPIAKSAGEPSVETDQKTTGQESTNSTSQIQPVVNRRAKDLGVAVITRVAGLSGDESRTWQVGTTVPPSTLTWDAGLVQLEFYSGATVVAEGPASIEILDAWRLVVQSGKIRAQVPKPAQGFAVLAPTVELIDLGTEFAMEVAESGSTSVHVFDGKVELYEPNSDRDATTRRELTAGDSVAVTTDGESKEIASREHDFVSPQRLARLSNTSARKRLSDWQAYRDILLNDTQVVAYFPFERSPEHGRTLFGYSGNGEVIQGAIVGCEWARGRFPGKPSLEFKRPGDRVRVHIPGEFESLTYSAWLRVDGYEREFNSLFLTDAYDENEPHWQIGRDGGVILGVHHPGEEHDYTTKPVLNMFRLGQWIHLATIYDGQSAQVSHYVDGKLVSQESLNPSANGLLKIGDATIGNWSQPRAENHKSIHIRNFNGRLDEFIIFKQALGEADVRRIYEVGIPDSQ